MTGLAPDLHDLAGTFGAVLYLGSYAALQAGLIRGQGYLYPALNALAASLVLISLGAYFNPFSATIETAWILISLFGIARLWILTRRLTFTEEERIFLDKAFPGLSRLGCRRLLEAGRWQDLPAGTRLIEEEQPVETLFWIASGAAAVSHRGTDIAAVPAEHFIGELGVFHRAAATATVHLTETAHLFTISRDALLRLVKRNPEVKLALDSGIGADARAKFLAGNTRLSTPRVPAAGPVPLPRSG